MAKNLNLKFTLQWLGNYFGATIADLKIARLIALAAAIAVVDY